MKILNSTMIRAMVLAMLLAVSVSSTKADVRKCRFEWEIDCSGGPWSCIERYVLKCDGGHPDLPPCYPNCK
jgi:hypothetical protein